VLEELQENERRKKITRTLIVPGDLEIAADFDAAAAAAVRKARQMPKREKEETEKQRTISFRLTV
jgi:hypothetical protein